jgi:ATP/ADP translocase
MNRYQKIALILGALALIIAYGKVITKIGIGAMALIGKGIVIIVATLLIFFVLKNRKKNE